MLWEILSFFESQKILKLMTEISDGKFCFREKGEAMPG